MNALPYVDQLFREYLLFRGFTSTIQAFNSDLANDKGQGFQVLSPGAEHLPPSACLPTHLLRIHCASNLRRSSDRPCTSLTSSTTLQADQITSLVFSRLIRQGRGKELLDLLEFLNARVYSRLDTSYEPTIRKLRVSRIVWYPASLRPWHALHGMKPAPYQYLP